MIPVEDLDLLEDLEDAHDAADITHAQAEDDGARITLDDLKTRLGIAP